MAQVDMTISFSFNVDGRESETIHTEDPATALDAYLRHCQDQGLVISDKLRRQLVELMRFKRITL